MAKTEKPEIPTLSVSTEARSLLGRPRQDKRDLTTMTDKEPI